MKTERNINLEILRLVAMLLIVTSHFCYLYGTSVADPAIPLNLLGIFAIGKWGGGR